MSRSSTIRLVLIVVLGSVLPLVAVIIAAEAYRARDYRSHFVERHGSPAVFYEEVIEDNDGHKVLLVRLENDRGIVVQGYAKVPKSTSDTEATSAGGRHPAFILLGGVRTGKRSLEYIDVTRNIVLLALDYPYEGKKSDLSAIEFMGSIWPIRRAIIDTPPAVMLGVDYLLARGDVDPERIVLVGGSVGAVFVPAVAAADPRIDAAAMLFGAADIETLMRANLKAPEWVARIGSWLGAVLTSPVEPAKYVGDISPRPLYMLTGTGDPRMP